MLFRLLNSIMSSTGDMVVNLNTCNEYLARQNLIDNAIQCSAWII